MFQVPSFSGLPFRVAIFKTQFFHAVNLQKAQSHMKKWTESQPNGHKKEQQHEETEVQGKEDAHLDQNFSHKSLMYKKLQKTSTKFSINFCYVCHCATGPL